jgi:hypothetical protein
MRRSSRRPTSFRSRKSKSSFYKKGKKSVLPVAEKAISPTFDAPGIQQKPEDNHNLQASRFAGDVKLEQVYDNKSVISYGARGEAVTKLQQAFTDSGHPLPVYGVDGIFGSETYRSVVGYQKSNGLVVDGVVGFGTMGSLDERFKNESPPSVIPNQCEELESILNGSNSLPTTSSKHNASPEGGGDPSKPATLPDLIEKCANPLMTNCNKQCGTPTNTKKGPAFSKGDVCTTLPGATYVPPGGVNCECVASDDVLRIEDSFTGSGNMKWLKVHVCQGTNAGTDKIIQHRFITDVQPLAPSISGPDKVEMGDKITLNANGVHTALRPQWNLTQPNAGKVNMTPSTNRHQAEIEGTNRSVSKNDIAIKIAACDKGSNLHTMTVIPPAKEKKQFPKLSKKTVTGPIPLNCGAYDWTVQWDLDKPSPAGGIIVQKVELDHDMKYCSSNAKVPHSLDRWMPFWEAWQVNPKDKTNVGQDRFANLTPFGAGTKTASHFSYKITGTAEFYEGVNLPKDFKVNTSSPAFMAPMTQKDPKLVGGSGSIDHILRADWNCCKWSPDKKTKLAEV